MNTDKGTDKDDKGRISMMQADEDDCGLIKTMKTDTNFDIDIQPEYPERELTGKILEAAFAVHNTLGSGFLERVYAKALTLELRRGGIDCVQEAQLKVAYRDTIVGDYIADVIVDNRVIMELKACASLDPSHSAQLMNYLRAARIRVGLLLNFGRAKLAYRRFVCWT